MRKILMVFAIIALIVTCGVTILDSRPSEEGCREICLQENPNMDPEMLSFCIGRCMGIIDEDPPF